MMKRNLMHIAFAFCLLACANQEKQKADEGNSWSVTLRGKVGFPGTGLIKVSEIGLGSDKDDTIKLKSNYSFEKTLRLTEPGYYRLNFYDLQYVDFILDKSDLEINVDGNSQGGYVEVLGSPDHKLISEIQQGLQEAQSGSKLRVLESEYQQAARKKDQRRMDELQDAYLASLRSIKDSVL